MPTARRSLATGDYHRYCCNRFNNWYNNVIVAVGGAQGDKELNTVEAYHFTTNTWTAQASMPTAREGLAVAVIDHTLYAVGGSANGRALNTVEAYNHLTDTWTTKAPMLTARNGLAVGVVNGILYAVGGDDANGHFLNTVEAYNPATNRWRGKASMPTARSDLAVGIVNGTLYAIGGKNGGGALTTNEAYHHWTNTWTAEPSMLTARSGLAAVGTLFPALPQLWAFGGDDAHGHILSAVEDYNPKLATWRKRVGLPTARTGLAATVFVSQGRPVFYIIGGYDGVDLNTVESLWVQN